MKRVAIVQSNYIPWKGYFDLIGMVDHFVLYDDVEFNRYNWRNRNRIKTPGGTRWLTIPVRHAGSRPRIQEIEIAYPTWNRKHWETLRHHYARAPYYSLHREFFEELYLGSQERRLSEINSRFLRAICGLWGIRTEFSWSRDYCLAEGRIPRVVDLCRQLGASVFLSGPTARPYIEEHLFREAGISVEWMSYDHYPEYRQLYSPPFIHEVSIVDLIFNEGAEGAWRFMQSARRRSDAPVDGPLVPC